MTRAMVGTEVQSGGTDQTTLKRLAVPQPLSTARTWTS